MKNKSASQSAFFNPRVLIGVFVLVTGVCLALLAFSGDRRQFRTGTAKAKNFHQVYRS